MDHLWDSQRKAWLTARSLDLGFCLAGITPVGDLDAPPEAEDDRRLEHWIEAGRAGEMDYLKRRDEAGRLLRGSIRVSQPWANSVIVCALSYAAEAPLSIAPAAPTAGWIARYAWSGNRADNRSGDSSGNQSGDSSGNQTDDRPDLSFLSAPPPPLPPTDYHEFLLARLRQLAQELGEQAGGATKCYVDTGPLLERSLAARAGIGWIGKNTCVLHQQQGSWLLLGVILTSLHLPPALVNLPAADRCGSCTRCLDACPTGALPAPHQMDASRCIAYLTIEKKGSIPADLRPLLGRQVFGCDICQDVCPWNQAQARHAPTAPVDPEIAPRPELINPDLHWLASLDAPAFKRWFKGSPLERTRRPRLHRNVAIAMGNSGDPAFIPRLTAWSQDVDPVLAEAARWALDQLPAASPASPASASPEPRVSPASPAATLC